MKLVGCMRDSKKKVLVKPITTCPQGKNKNSMETYGKTIII